MPEQSWITRDGLSSAIAALRLSKAHEQTPVFLGMKLVGVNDLTPTEFASNSGLRQQLFDRYLAVPGRQYFNPFSGSVHVSGYPHGSQYTVAREIRKPRWRETLDWSEPAGKGVTNFDVKFMPGYVDALKDHLLGGGKLPFWAIATLCQARAGPLPSIIASPPDLIEHWAKIFKLTTEERDRLVDLTPPPSIQIIGPDELPQEEVDKIIMSVARASDRASEGSSQAASGSKQTGPAQEQDLPLNLIIYGPPGTGKTRKVIEEYLPLFTDEDGTERFVFTTFHPSYFYEDFVEGLRPVLAGEDDGGGSEIKYNISPGVFKNICALAESEPEKPHAIFIDEINRGKIDNLFGDLITLIDADKRGRVSVVLPYSKEKFSVPANLHIIGTMNTADRSIALLDVALRRRFDFVEIVPDAAALRAMLESAGAVGGVIEGIDVPRLLEALNARLEALAGRDRLVGHGWLAGVASFDDLRACFARKIIPLLGEYFHDDFSKIVEVLNDDGGFFAKVPAAGSGSFGLGEGATYRVVASETWSPALFSKVYEDELKIAPE